MLNLIWGDTLRPISKDVELKLGSVRGPRVTHRMVSWHQIPPKRWLPPRSLTASLSLKSYRNPIGKHSSKHPFSGVNSLLNFRRVSWNLEVEVVIFFMPVDWKTLRSCLFSRQQRLEVTTKVWSTDEFLDTSSEIWDTTCQFDLLETLWPEAWFEEWSCFNANTLVNYSDLTRPISPKWWFSKGNGTPAISGKSRLVKYYNLARNTETPWDDDCWMEKKSSIISPAALPNLSYEKVPTTLQPWGLLTCPSWSIFDYSRKVLKAASWVSEWWSYQKTRFVSRKTVA